MSPDPDSKPEPTSGSNPEPAGRRSLPSVGDQELALLRFLAERGGATVGEAAEGFGTPRDLARSTVLTMMERLRKKGHLSRRKVAGVYRYESPASTGELLRGVVEQFVERTLGGSVSPFVTYLAETATVSDDELAELEELVSRLHADRPSTPPDDSGADR
jgi:predicted transcriptional regulator